MKIEGQGANFIGEKIYLRRSAHFREAGLCPLLFKMGETLLRSDKKFDF